jgi:hypothetical protein
MGNLTDSRIGNPGPNSDAFDPNRHNWDGHDWWTLDGGYWWDGSRWQPADIPRPRDEQASSPRLWWFAPLLWIALTPLITLPLTWAISSEILRSGMNSGVCTYEGFIGGIGTCPAGILSSP